MYDDERLGKRCPSRDDKNDKMTDRETAQEGVRALLRLSVEDPSREGLEDPLADRFLGLVRQS